MFALFILATIVCIAIAVFTLCRLANSVKVKSVVRKMMIAIIALAILVISVDLTFLIMGGCKTYGKIEITQNRLLNIFSVHTADDNLWGVSDGQLLQRRPHYTVKPTKLEFISMPIENVMSKPFQVCYLPFSRHIIKMEFEKDGFYYSFYSSDFNDTENRIAAYLLFISFIGMIFSFCYIRKKLKQCEWYDEK